jgi:hypothetical protein
VSERLQRNGRPFFLQSWSEIGVLIHLTGVLWDSGQDSGLASPFLNLILHK